jgi:hypothetical protein
VQNLKSLTTLTPHSSRCSSSRRHPAPFSKDRSSEGRSIGVAGPMPQRKMWGDEGETVDDEEDADAGAREGEMHPEEEVEEIEIRRLVQQYQRDIDALAAVRERERRTHDYALGIVPGSTSRPSSSSSRASSRRGGPGIAASGEEQEEQEERAHVGVDARLLQVLAKYGHGAPTGTAGDDQAHAKVEAEEGQDEAARAPKKPPAVGADPRIVQKIRELSQKASSLVLSGAAADEKRGHGAGADKISTSGSASPVGCFALDMNEAAPASRINMTHAAILGAGATVSNGGGGSAVSYVIPPLPAMSAPLWEEQQQQQQQQQKHLPPSKQGRKSARRQRQSQFGGDGTAGADAGALVAAPPPVPAASTSASASAHQASRSPAKSLRVTRSPSSNGPSFHNNLGVSETVFRSTQQQPVPQGPAGGSQFQHSSAPCSTSTSTSSAGTNTGTGPSPLPHNEFPFNPSPYAWLSSSSSNKGGGASSSSAVSTDAARSMKRELKANNILTPTPSTMRI